MNRSNAPPPIRTSATPASGGGYKNNYPPSNDFGHRDANNNSAYQQYSGYDDTTNNISGYDDPNAAEQHNNNMMMMPTSSAMRQGRFAPGLDPTNNMNSVNTAAQLEPPQQHQQQQFNSASSQVTFHSGAAPPQPTSADTLQQNMESSSNFMFDEMEDFQHYMNNTPHNNNNNDTNTTNHGGIPTETQLTLLCLDYLRSLRRSYHANPQDLYHGEGLDADYLSLAIWSLSRAFVAPGKLKFEKAKGSSVLEEEDDMDNGVNKKGKKKKSSSKSGGMVKEICIVGGGGLAGVEDECVGNDSVYRLDVRTKRQQHDDDDGDDDDNNNNNNNNSIEIDTSSTEVFALTKDIKLPSMTDITKEVLLSYNNNNDDDDAATNNDEDESPIYEQNDMHLSNSHRFYLFNGMASGDDSQGMMGGGGGGGGAAGAATKKSAGPSIIDGGPLTLTDLASVALSTLNAKSRIEAEREVVSDPLFESFIKAASEKGFFTESKLEGKDTLSPEAEEHRQRLLYENKYRKVVAKFRSKLAVREEQQMLHHGGGFGGGSGAYVGSGGWSPRSGQRAMNNVHSVSDRLEMRRDRIINEVKEYRLEEEEGEEDPFVPHLVCEEQQQQQFQKVQREQLLDIVADYAREKQIVRDLVSPRARSEPFKGFKEFQSNNAKVAERMTEEEEEDGFIPMNPSSQVDEAPPTPVDEAPPTPVAYQMNPSFPVDEAPPTPVASSFATPRTTTMDPPSSSSPEVPPNYQEAESMNAQGNELMQKKQFNQALEMYTTALKISPAGPNSHAYYSNRSAAHLSLGDAESSIRDSQMALTIRPDYAKAHSRLGLAHYASGRYQEAVDSYEAALDLEPDNVWVMKKYDKVKKVLAKVQNEKDKEAVTRDEEGGGSVSPYAGTMIDEAAKRKGAEIVRQADEYKDAGNAFMKDKNFEDALDQYNIAIGISPDGPNSHIYYSNRAAAYCYLGQYSEAADDCLSSIALNETYEKAYSRYGLSLFFLGDYEGSIDAYGKSLELAPDNKASLSYLAKAKARLAAQQENEMQEYMAKKLNLSCDSEEKPVAGREEEIQQDLGFREEISVARREEEIYQNVHAEEGFFSKNGLSQSRDDDGEGIEASYSGMKGPGQFEKGYDPPGEIMKTYSPFDEEEGDEI